jgi:integrase
MAGTVRYVKIETRTARMKLKPGTATYWRNLVLGRLSVGYQRRTSGAPGRWLARTTLGADRYSYATLGFADDYDDADGINVLNFADASASALKSYRGDGAAAPSIVSVADAINDYIEWLKAHRATGRDAEVRAAKLILPALGRLRLSELTSARITHWLEKLAEGPALVRTGLGAPQKFKKAPLTTDARRARRASANRTLTILKAALNRAFTAGAIGDDAAWRRVKPFEKVSASRPGFLTVEEARRLINGCDPDSRPLVEAALLTGCRWGELRALRVGDFVNGKIHIARSKSGKPRDVVLTEEGGAFFAAATIGRASAELLFVHDDGSPWLKSQQARPMREACAHASIKPAIGFHQLRHTWASLAVMNGMPLMVVARNLGHATTIMVERHYGHLTTTFVDEAVRASAPRFGIAAPPSSVARLRR